MKNLNEHNATQDQRAPIQRREPAGVYCPRCQATEMLYMDGMTLMVDPPKMRVECPACGYIGEKIT